MTTTGPSRRAAAPQAISRVFRFVREVVALIVWLAPFTKLFIFDFDTYLANRYFPHYAWVLQYRFFGLLMLVALLCVFAGSRWFWSGLTFVVAYPIIVLWRICWLLLRNWPVVFAFSPAIHSFIRQFRSHCLWIVVAMLAIGMVAIFEHPLAIGPAMAGLGAYLCRHYWLDFRKAFAPSSVFADLAGAITTMRGMASDPFASWIQELSLLNPSSEEYRKKQKHNLETAYILTSGIQGVVHQFRKVVKSRVLDGYLIWVFFLTFLTTIVVFGVEYWGLYKLNPFLFEPSSGLGFWDFIGLSLTTVMTDSISQVKPVGGPAQVLCHVETVFTVLLVTIGVSLVMSVMRERFSEDVERVSGELDTVVDAIERKLDEHFHLTHDQLEEQVLVVNLKLVNVLRWLNGLQERAAPPESSDGSPVQGSATESPMVAGELVLPPAPDTSAATGSNQDASGAE